MSKRKMKIAFKIFKIVLTILQRYKFFTYLGGFAAQERFDLEAVVCASARTTAVKPHSCGAREQKVRRQKVSLFAWVPGKRR